MEKINQYENTVIDLLHVIYTDSGDGDDKHEIIDKERHHYQLLRAGWDNKQHYFYRVRVHLHIRADGKICLLENRTELDIAEMLTEKGVAKSDIVLSFLPENVRQYAGYAQ
jgi:glutathionylspermidine synthase